MILGISSIKKSMPNSTGMF